MASGASTSSRLPVMPGFGPGIHVFAPLRRHGQDEPGHDGGPRPCRREAAMTRSFPAPPPPPLPTRHSPFAIRQAPHPQLACASPSVILSDPDRRPALDRRRMGVARDWVRFWRRGERVDAKASIRGRCCSMSCGCRSAASARRLRGGRLRRLHGGARTGQGQAAAVQAVNACILLLGQADGAEIVTVEDLAGRTCTPSRPPWSGITARSAASARPGS